MLTLVGIAGLGTTELIVILGICVLLFGAARIPALAKSVGKSISEFKKGMSEGAREVEENPQTSKQESASAEAAKEKKD
jgi:sec-independent protein translocase protein TatA